MYHILFVPHLSRDTWVVYTFVYKYITTFCRTLACKYLLESLFQITRATLRKIILGSYSNSILNFTQGDHETAFLQCKAIFPDSHLQRIRFSFSSLLTYHFSAVCLLIHLFITNSHLTTLVISVRFISLMAERYSGNPLMYLLAICISSLRCLLKFFAH